MTRPFGWWNSLHEPQPRHVVTLNSMVQRLTSRPKDPPHPRRRRSLKNFVPMNRGHRGTLQREDEGWNKVTLTARVME